jgi:alpha-glucosidase (family GH31 glycosyl hydrolase)
VRYSKRWVQFGLLSSHSRLHGSETYRVPWQFDDESSLVLSKFTKLKNRLEPYLTTLSIEGAVKSGHPLMRAMFLEFPQDPTAWLVDSQYMLGDALLVAPVFDEDDVEYYVPPGSWTSLLDGRRVQGGTFVNETHSHTTLPLLLRQDHALIIGKEGHTVLDKISDETKGFTVVVSSSIPKKITARSVLRDGSHIECSIEAAQSPDGKDVKIVVNLVSELDDKVPWEVLVIGDGVGLDSKEPSTLQQAKGKVCEVNL